MNNKTMLQFFHWYYPKEGTLWKELEEKGSETCMGITSVWLPPAFKAGEGKNSVSNEAIGADFSVDACSVSVWVTEE